jgi:hypothetical protein
MILAEEITSPSFAGHESFTLRYGWLSKGVQAALKHPDLFSREDALVLLGVGKNMVRSIRYWGLATGFLQEDAGGRMSRGISPSPLGSLILGPHGLDPFLEDPATLWLIHWQMASSPDGPTTWYWAFNEFQEPEFTREKMRAALRRFIDKAGWKRVADSSLNRDVDCFIRSYASAQSARSALLEETLDCPLTDLGLIHETDGVDAFTFNRGEHPTLPQAVFTYALLTFWARLGVEKKTVTFDQVAFQAGSPGRVFKLSETALTDFLEKVEKLTHGAIGYDVTAGLRQLYRRRDLGADAATKILERHYVQGGH